MFYILIGYCASHYILNMPRKTNSVDFKAYTGNLNKFRSHIIDFTYVFDEFLVLIIIFLTLL